MSHNVFYRTSVLQRFETVGRWDDTFIPASEAYLSQPGEILIEGRVGDIYAVAAKDLCVAVGVKSGNGEAHGDAVVEVAVDDSAVKRLAAMDDHAIIGSANICAHSGKVLHHNIDPV